jgi:hypothetical protein
MLINISKIPTHTIDLCNFLKPYDIVKYMKKNNITSYVYAFIYHKTIMKYGVHYDLAKGVHGERIYRQSFHITGWPKKASLNSSGNDILDVLIHFPGINKNLVSIQIWDMSLYPRASSTNPKFEVNQLERQLIKNHTNLVGYRPVGNIKDESHMDSKSIVTDQQFDSLFDHE